jgi:hypothetical protein
LLAEVVLLKVVEALLELTAVELFLGVVAGFGLV